MSAQNRQTDERAIRAVLARYEQALNGSDTETVMALYADDGVFSAIKLSVKFDVVEVRAVSPTWAFARTNSAGGVKVLADGSGGPEGNQELFVFEKAGSGDWKIARYCFSTTNPPRN